VLGLVLGYMARRDVIVIVEFRVCLLSESR